MELNRELMGIANSLERVTAAWEKALADFEALQGNAD
jgi:hypothetical protein